MRPSIAKYAYLVNNNVDNKEPEPESDGYETDYSVDSQGNFKLDSNGRKIPRYELDPETGLPLLDANGNPIKKRKKKGLGA